MKDRLLEFLKSENKSSAQLAEEIGVQPSGISHILSGRNNPSLDFVLKMLDRYKFLSTEWLLFGKGSMYKEPRMQNLFDYDPDIKANNSPDSITEAKKIVPGEPFGEAGNPDTSAPGAAVRQKTTSEVIKIVWFYGDNTFEEFVPGK